MADKKWGHGKHTISVTPSEWLDMGEPRNAVVVDWDGKRYTSEQFKANRLREEREERSCVMGRSMNRTRRGYKRTPGRYITRR